MTTLETLSLCLLGVVVFVGILRGVLDRAWLPFLVSLAAFPPLLVTCLHLDGLIDISSAHHPARIGSSLVAVSASMLGAHIAAKEYKRANLWGYLERPRRRAVAGRQLVACIIVFAISCTSVPALFTWTIPGEYLIVPLQILACFAVAVVLLVPERWLRWKTS